MGLPQKAIRNRGFTLVEILTVLTISSMLLALLAMVFKTGLTQVSRSSGRIEVVRMGRQALNNIQRYLASAVAPSTLSDVNGETFHAVYWPDPSEIYDPNSPTNPDPQDTIAFFTPADHLNNAEMPKARELQNNPITFPHGISVVPGLNGRGQDLVLRRLQAPTGGIPSLNPNTSLKPRYLGRGLGLKVSGTTSYRDGLVVRRYAGEGAFQLIVNVSGDTVSDDYIRNTSKNGAPLKVSMSTIFQPPIFNVQ